MSTDENVFMCAVNIILMIEMREKKERGGEGGRGVGGKRPKNTRVP